MARIPEDRFYSENHLWVKKGKRKTAKIGVTDYFLLKHQEVLDIDLPTEEEEFSKDEIFGSLETMDKIYDLIAPVSFKVIKVNEEVLDDIEILNEDPYEEGWLLQVELLDPDELDDLLPAEDYELEFMEDVEPEFEEEFLEREEEEE